MADPLDHLCLCRILGWNIGAALRLLSQIHPSDLALDHEFGRSAARGDRRRFGNTGRSRGRCGPRAAVEELCFRLSRTMEYVTRSRIPVHRHGDARRRSAWFQPTDGRFAWREAMTDPALEVIG